MKTIVNSCVDVTNCRAISFAQTNHASARGGLKGRKQISPGQSAAPPWVNRHATAKALKGRDTIPRGFCCALSGNAVKDFSPLKIGVLVNWEI